MMLSRVNAMSWRSWKHEFLFLSGCANFLRWVSLLLHRSDSVERCIAAGSMCVRPYVKNVRLCTANKLLNVKYKFLKTYVVKLHPPTFVQIVNVLCLSFQGQRFEWSTLRSSYVIISQTVTDWTNIAIDNTESRMWPFDLHIYVWHWQILKVGVKVKYVKHCCCQEIQILKWPSHWQMCIWYWRILKVKVKVMHISTVNISQTVTDKQTLPSATNRKSHVGCRLTDLHLTVVHSNGQGQGHLAVGTVSRKIFWPSCLFDIKAQSGRRCRTSTSSRSTKSSRVSASSTWKSIQTIDTGKPLSRPVS